MKREAIEKARVRLGRAREAAKLLERPDGHIDFETAWTDFLLAANGVYTCLEQGAKATPQSRQWFGGKKQERRKDSLLQYLHQARNADEHGLDRTTPELEAEDTVTIPHGGNIAGIRLTLPDGRVVLQPLPPEAAQVRLKLWSVTLTDAVDSRYKTTYPPPREHLGKPIPENTPDTVAKLALDYLTALIDEAERRVP
ncbi:MAG TPA: hypothetical protein VJS15_03115 [Allosphingosinicella sp.]|nr:hypothetical protein [Allosphingosinicella sp.]